MCHPAGSDEPVDPGECPDDTGSNLKDDWILGEDPEHIWSADPEHHTGDQTDHDGVSQGVFDDLANEIDTLGTVEHTHESDQ